MHPVVLDGTHALFLERLAGHTALELRSQVGKRLPLHASGPGKVLLAHAPVEVLDAAHYGVGVLVVVLANGRYAVLDRLAEQHGGGRAPWPAFDEVSVSGLATALGCPARRVEDHDDLVAVLDSEVPGLGARRTPLLLEVAVTPDAGFAP